MRYGKDKKVKGQLRKDVMWLIALSSLSLLSQLFKVQPLQTVLLQLVVMQLDWSGLCRCHTFPVLLSSCDLRVSETTCLGALVGSQAKLLITDMQPTQLKLVVKINNGDVL